MMIKVVLFLNLFISCGFVVVTGLSYPIYPVLFVLLLFLILNRGVCAIEKKCLAYFLIFIFIFLLLVAIRGESLFYKDNFLILVKLIISLISILYLSTFKHTYVFTKYVRLVEGLIFLSLVTFILSNLSPSLLFTYNIDGLGNNHQTWLGLGFFRKADFIKYGFLRNQSIFWEPGVYGCILIISYFIKVYLLREKDKLWLFYAGIISTASMGTIIIFLGLFFHKKFYLDAFRLPRKVRTFIIVTVMLIGYSLVVFALNDFPLFIKILSTVFLRDLTADSSLVTRGIDFYYGITSAFDRIFTGHGNDFTGFYSLTLAELNKSKESYDGGITNSMINMVYRYGIVFTAFYLYLIIKFCGKVYRPHAILLSFIIIGCLMLEPLYLSLFVFILLFYGSGNRLWFSFGFKKV